MAEPSTGLGSRFALSSLPGVIWVQADTRGHVLHMSGAPLVETCSGTYRDNTEAWFMWQRAMNIYCVPSVSPPTCRELCSVQGQRSGTGELSFPPRGTVKGCIPLSVPLPCPASGPRQHGRERTPCDTRGLTVIIPGSFKCGLQRQTSH